MDNSPDNLVDRILAENDKINQLNSILNAARKDLAEGDDQFRNASEKLEKEEYSEALDNSIAAVEYYEKVLLFAQQVNDAVNSTQDIVQLKKEAFDLLLNGKTFLARAKKVQFIIEDIKGLQTDVEREVAAENWVLVSKYAGDTLSTYPNSNWFRHYAELAENKIVDQKPQKTSWLDFFFRR